ncbi:hypothetical protein TNCV_1601091 [Trichonephila clavipes]|nr:hypothetical protein TNCV_1601091 [Trichonephila clavipes]
MAQNMHMELLAGGGQSEVGMERNLFKNLPHVEDRITQISVAADYKWHVMDLLERKKFHAAQLSGGFRSSICVRFFNIIAYLIGEFNLNYGSFMVNSARFQFKKQVGHFIPNHHTFGYSPCTSWTDLPIPSPLDTLDNMLDDLDQISHISIDSDDGYDPGTNDPELFSQSDLNDLLRDLGLPKNTAEVLGSILKERHLLNYGVSFSWYRFR